jgi:membrane protease YdiL (CAAX protease family)
MSSLNATYLVIVELTIWLFVAQGLGIFLPVWASTGVLLVLAYKRFGSKVFMCGFRLDKVCTLPVLFLVCSSVETQSFRNLIYAPQLAVLIPFQEEVVYRFIIPAVVAKRFSKRFVSVIISTITFCFAHRNTFPRLSTDMLVCVAAALALSNRTLGRNGSSIVESFVIHSLHNMHALSASSGHGMDNALVPLSFYGYLIGIDTLRSMVLRRMGNKPQGLAIYLSNIL